MPTSAKSKGYLRLSGRFFSGVFRQTGFREKPIQPRKGYRITVAKCTTPISTVLYSQRQARLGSAGCGLEHMSDTCSPGLDWIRLVHFDRLTEIVSQACFTVLNAHIVDCNRSCPDIPGRTLRHLIPHLIHPKHRIWLAWCQCVSIRNNSGDNRTHAGRWWL